MEVTMRNNIKSDLVVETLIAWLDNPEPAMFPYDLIVAEYHRTGKHFVSDRLLKTLVRARKVCADVSNLGGDTMLLREFLRSALDKWDGCYEYTTYIAVGLLPIPTIDTMQEVPLALQRRDRLVVQLAADEISFELAAADGRTEMLPEMRPTRQIITKRCRLVMRVVAPALQRLGLSAKITASDPDQAARELCMAVLTDLPMQDRRILQLSLLPVYIAHDEYLFIRVLQMFETTFALLAVTLYTAIRALAEHNCAAAVQSISIAESTLNESAPMLSLLATMEPESFDTFRGFTEGAGAIQSRNYKIMEALCHKPTTERLNSVAYFSVPEVRNWVLADNPATLDDAVRSASSWLKVDELEALSAAMARFSATLMHWRQTHYRLAVRMLGEQAGTGSTPGAPYLNTVRTIPVFQSIAHVKGDN
jgi:tryptophan 2,3-dioxygenase